MQSEMGRLNSIVKRLKASVLASVAFVKLGFRRLSVLDPSHVNSRLDPVTQVERQWSHYSTAAGVSVNAENSLHEAGVLQYICLPIRAETLALWHIQAMYTP